MTVLRKTLCGLVALTSAAALSLSVSAANAAVTPATASETFGDSTALVRVVTRGAFAGATWDQSRRTVTVGATADLTEAERLALAAVALPTGWKIELKTVPRSWADLHAIQDRIGGDSAFARKFGAALTEWDIDARSDSVSVGLLDPSSDAQRAADEEFGADSVSVHAGTQYTLFNASSAASANAAGQSRDSEPGGPFHAGDDIVTDSTGQKEGEACTGGFAIKIGSTKYFLTAGHCGTGTSTSSVYAGFTKGSNQIGSVVHRTYNDGAWDTEYYSAAASNVSAAAWIGGQSSTTGKTVRGSYTPANGETACGDGSTSGEFCDGIVNLNGGGCANFYNKVNGVTEHVCNLGRMDTSTAAGHHCYGGDSGGPVEENYSSGLYAVGAIVGGDDSHCFFHPISSVLSHWGASLVTG